MDCEQIVASLIQELRRGTLIMLVLSLLKKPAYGYSLIKDMEQYGISIEANTLYPLMRRLESQGLLISQWDTSEAKPRKNYVLTPLGSEVLLKTKEAWSEISANINKVMEETENEGK